MLAGVWKIDYFSINDTFVCWMSSQFICSFLLSTYCCTFIVTRYYNDLILHLHLPSRIIFTHDVKSSTIYYSLSADECLCGTRNHRNIVTINLLCIHHSTKCHSCIQIMFFFSLCNQSILLENKKNSHQPASTLELFDHSLISFTHPSLYYDDS